MLIELGCDITVGCSVKLLSGDAKPVSRDPGAKRRALEGCAKGFLHLWQKFPKVQHPITEFQGV